MSHRNDLQMAAMKSAVPGEQFSDLLLSFLQLHGAVSDNVMTPGVSSLMRVMSLPATRQTGYIAGLAALALMSPTT